MTARRKRPRRASMVVMSALGCLFALAFAVFLVYEAFTGGPLFQGSSTWDTRNSFDKLGVANDGVVPYSADQWVLLLAAVLALYVAALIPLLWLRAPDRPTTRLAWAALAAELVISLAVMAVDIVWAATGHRFSNYLSPSSGYPQHYAVPIGICALVAVLSVGGMLGMRRLGRLARRSRARVRGPRT